MTNMSPPPPAPMLHLGHPESHLPLFGSPSVPSKPVSHRGIALIFVLAAATALLGWGLEHYGHAAAAPDVSLPWVIPFALLLAAIATMPFVARHFWEHNYPWVSIGLGGLVVGYYGLGLQAFASMAKSLGEYVSFIFLLGSLFIVSGGILIRVRRTATPSVNTGLLLIGAILANFVGTTGASMLLIRPFLRINRGNIKAYHVVFFIFIVSNVGGALTPIGDPPLFLGYLKGVPFWWVAEHCYGAWLVAVGVLLAVFFGVDTLGHRKGARAAHDVNDPGPAVSIYGAGNILFLALILVGVFLTPPVRELLMVLAACGSLWTTPQRIHYENVFNFAPIREIALLFVGIFATMVPALNYLQNHAHDPALSRYLQTPGQYYYVSGGLSSVLDNAPTYMVFLETELGKIDKAALRSDQTAVGYLLADEKLNWYIVAISLGSVFFGALTYIGNGPNFMVKSMAEHAGVKCPSFFGYIACYSLPILLPVLVLVWVIFLRPHAGP